MTTGYGAFYNHSNMFGLAALGTNHRLDVVRPFPARLSRYFIILWPPTLTISTLALFGVITSSACVEKSFASTEVIALVLSSCDLRYARRHYRVLFVNGNYLFITKWNLKALTH